MKTLFISYINGEQDEFEMPQPKAFAALTKLTRMNEGWADIALEDGRVMAINRARVMKVEVA